MSGNVNKPLMLYLLRLQVNFGLAAKKSKKPIEEVNFGMAARRTETRELRGALAMQVMSGGRLKGGRSLGL